MAVVEVQLPCVGATDAAITFGTTDSAASLLRVRDEASAGTLVLFRLLFEVPSVRIVVRCRNPIVDARELTVADLHHEDALMINLHGFRVDDDGDFEVVKVVCIP